MAAANWVRREGDFTPANLAHALVGKGPEKANGPGQWAVRGDERGVS
jgi:hypothetical protein